MLGGNLGSLLYGDVFVMVSKVVQAKGIVQMVLRHVTVLVIIYQLFGINIEIMYKISSSMLLRGNFWLKLEKTITLLID